MKLRDIEVQSDDFERQARNTSSSLGDMESKLNVAIERGVMMEEDIKIGEQEREALRIETQRLRDELSDLKVEAEVMQDKLRKTSVRLPALSTNLTAPNSPSLDHSPDSASSSPMITTPPDTKSVSTADSVSETPTPPSPPVSDRSMKAKKLSVLKTPMQPPSKMRTPSNGDHSTTPKPRYPSTSHRPLTRSRATNNLTGNAHKTPTLIRNAASKAPATRGLPNSQSLNHIRSLTAQMQRLEQRVQSARSKLPAPTYTPPRASPRNAGAGPGSGNAMPSNVTIRSRKRSDRGSTISSAVTSGSEETSLSTKPGPRVSTSGISRLSFGPLPSRGETHEKSEGVPSRPSSRASISASAYARPTSRAERPASRSDSYTDSVSRGEHARPASRADGGHVLGRPASRTSMNGTRTPLGHYSQSSISESRHPSIRPRSSIGQNFGASYHGHSNSASGKLVDVIPDEDEATEMDFATPSRRGSAMGFRIDDSAIPVLSGLPRRQSGGPVQAPPVLTRRTSQALQGEMRPPASTRNRKLSEVGESY